MKTFRNPIFLAALCLGLLVFAAHAFALEEASPTPGATLAQADPAVNLPEVLEPVKIPTKEEEAAKEKGAKKKKRISIYSKWAYKAHKKEIDSFRQTMKGAGAQKMGDSALADLNVATSLVNLNEDGTEYLAAAPSPENPVQKAWDKTYQRYAFYNRYSDEWDENFNDPYYMPPILDGWLRYLSVPEPWNRCPTYFMFQGFRFLNDGGYSALMFQGSFCPTVTTVRPSPCQTPYEYMLYGY